MPEFADFIGENRFLIYLDIMNLGNLIDDKDGIVREYSYNTSRQIVVNGVDDQGRVNITGVDPDDNLYTTAGEGKSSWEMRVGFKYQF